MSCVVVSYIVYHLSHIVGSLGLHGNSMNVANPGVTRNDYIYFNNKYDNNIDDNNYMYNNDINIMNI